MSREVGSGTARCRWCEAGLSDAARSGPRRLRCPQCGAETTFPYPDAVELDRAYGDWYRPPGGRFSGPGDAVLRHTRGRLARRLDAIAPAGPILDVGSGDGALLRALHARGREASGVERTEEGADRETLLGSRRWAGIVFWHSLEHLPDAGRWVQHLRGALLPGGVVVIAVPNPASLQARAFGDRWLALDLPRHLVHIPAEALIGGVRGAGLRVERVSHLRGGQVVFGWLHGLVGLLPSHPDLYDAVRRPTARRERLTGGRRVGVLAAAVALLPLAALAAAVEVVAGRGGTIYLEARSA